MINEFHYQTRGRGHEKNNTRGQDRTAFVSRNGIRVICLADGAGSASHSEYGAQAVVREACEILVREFQNLTTSNDADGCRKLVLNALLARLREIAERRSCAVKDLASTLLAVAISDDRFVALHVGDGVIGMLRNDETIVVSHPENDEFSNTTTFVTSSRAYENMDIIRGKLDGVNGFILMSDGAAWSLYNNKLKQLAPRVRFWIETVASAPTYHTRNPKWKKDLRASIETEIKTLTKDDCSIGILALRNKS